MCRWTIIRVLPYHQLCLFFRWWSCCSLDLPWVNSARHVAPDLIRTHLFGEVFARSYQENPTRKLELSLLACLFSGVKGAKRRFKKWQAGGSTWPIRARMQVATIDSHPSSTETRYFTLSSLALLNYAVLTYSFSVYLAISSLSTIIVRPGKIIYSLSTDSIHAKNKGIMVLFSVTFGPLIFAIRKFVSIWAALAFPWLFAVEQTKLHSILKENKYCSQLVF